MYNDDFFFEKLKKRLSEDIDFQAQFYGEKHLKRRLHIRMRYLNIGTFREYEQKLKSDPQEYDHLLKVLTVNVTEWFRNPEVYNVLKELLTQMLIEMKKSHKMFIRIWSMGCSDGKEPYSVAMLLYDLLSDHIKEYTIVIFASDIDDEILQKARAGVYLEEEMKGLTPEQIKKYFTKTDEKYVISPELRGHVKFEKRDILKDRYHVGIDIIFCRNVVIYFTPELKRKLYLEIYKSLTRGGYLVSGKTENLIGEAKSLFLPVDSTNRIYRKAQR